MRLKRGALVGLALLVVAVLAACSSNEPPTDPDPVDAVWDSAKWDEARWE